jgi:uncharacterized membrane protein YozB (DUF420 family)
VYNIFNMASKIVDTMKREAKGIAIRRREENMHNRTKVAILSAASNLIWFILTFIWNRSRVTSLDGEALARAWGIYFLVLIAGFLLLNALSAILVMTREKRSGGQGFEEKTDERDRHIEGFAMKAFGAVLFLAFLVSVSLLAMGQGLHAFFCALAFMVLLSSLAMWMTYIVGYERGL